jgi:hypothetical protein
MQESRDNHSQFDEHDMLNCLLSVVSLSFLVRGTPTPRPPTTDLFEYLVEFHSDNVSSNETSSFCSSKEQCTLLSKADPVFQSVKFNLIYRYEQVFNGIAIAVSNKEDGTKLKKSPLVKSIYFVVCIS